MAIDTAKLRNRVGIQVPIRTRGVQGSFSIAWALLRTIYCQIQPIFSPTDFQGAWRSTKQGKEMAFAGKTRSQTTHVITSRVQPEWLTQDMRLVEAIKQGDNPVYRIFNITEALMLENIRNEMRFEVAENISDPESATADYNVLYDDLGYSMTGDDGEYVVIS